MEQKDNKVGQTIEIDVVNLSEIQELLPKNKFIFGEGTLEVWEPYQGPEGCVLKDGDKYKGEYLKRFYNPVLDNGGKADLHIVIKQDTEKNIYFNVTATGVSYEKKVYCMSDIKFHDLSDCEKKETLNRLYERELHDFISPGTESFEVAKGEEYIVLNANLVNWLKSYKVDFSTLNILKLEQDIGDIYGDEKISYEDDYPKFAKEVGFTIAYNKKLSNDNTEFIYYNKKANAFLHFELDKYGKLDSEYSYNKCSTVMMPTIDSSGKVVVSYFRFDYNINETLNEYKTTDWPLIGLGKDYYFRSTEDKKLVDDNNFTYEQSMEFYSVRTIQKIAQNINMASAFLENNKKLFEETTKKYGFTSEKAIKTISEHQSDRFDEIC